MARSIGAVLAGIVVFYLLVMGLEMVNLFVIHPPPGGIQSLSDPETMAAYMAEVPLMALVVVLIAHGIGVFGGAWTAASIADRNRLIHGSIIWILGLLGAVLNMVQIEHPLWFMILDVVFFPVFGMLGTRLAERRAGAPAQAVSGMGHVPSEEDVDSESPTDRRSDRD